MRLEPECFIEQFKTYNNIIQTKVYPISYLSSSIFSTELTEGLNTIAIFLIKPSNLSLEERMERRCGIHSLDMQWRCIKCGYKTLN
jgi:hypothetical protein